MFLVFAVMTATVSLGILLNHPDYSSDIQAYIDSIDEKIEYRQNLWIYCSLRMIRYAVGETFNVTGASEAKVGKFWKKFSDFVLAI